VIVALLLMQIKPIPKRLRASSALEEMVTGLRYSIKHLVIRTLIVIIGMIGLFSTAYITLFPAWAVTVLHGDATTILLESTDQIQQSETHATQHNLSYPLPKRPDNAYGYVNDSRLGPFAFTIVH
jgi:hypothetical protein